MKTKTVLKTAGNFLSSFITALVAITAILFVLIRLLGWNMFSVDSPSMSPKYPVNTLVIVQKVEPEAIKVGDVITYVLNTDGVLVTHRVVSIDSSSRTFTTKGDANNNEDAPVLWDNVVGKVFIGIPALGKPLRFLTAEENRPVVITVIAALFAFSFLWELMERKKKKKKYKHEEQSGEDSSDGEPSPDGLPT
ncbi:MAG: signal peptidase I [Acutalibacteraceae bacterium]